MYKEGEVCVGAPYGHCTVSDYRLEKTGHLLPGAKNLTDEFLWYNHWKCVTEYFISYICG